ncbi:MAG: hypothetical protein IIU45_03615 [Lachnospiraceae bacterium]|nr:hypothetical protein [Lachnospiraceae bacterium]MBQ5375938.1 hypothetical protein [Lachnospiraceae bacterium]
MSDVAVDHGTLNSVARKVDRIEEQNERIQAVVNELNGVVERMEHSVDDLNRGLLQLSNDFKAMMMEQQRAANLQQAMTELVRVRQELDQKFGNYRVVRETMLGVLQASDLALVKKTTISKVSEEIMLSTPEYWLAPCLVAVAAWIGNDRDLAQRAIAEAMRRDEEKTAITMALICRRNNRTQTCYEWLAIYFSHQNAASFSETSFAYVDAYVNGIFGPDENHMCDDYITKWMNEIRGNQAAVEEQQDKVWKEFCDQFRTDINAEYPDLSQSAVEYPQINDYLSRINAVNPIADKLSGINNAYVDENTLKEKVDKRLISLISMYDGKEESLRKEEKYLMTVKKYNGDTVTARNICAEEERREREKTLNLVEQMAHIVVSDENTSPSQKKTALSFMSGYIRHGFNSYMEEKKEAFPQTISVNIDGWIGQTTDGSNVATMMTEYETAMNNGRYQRVQSVTTKKPQMFMIGAIAVAVLALIFLVVNPAFTVVLLAGAGFLAWKWISSKKEMDQNIVQINHDYDVAISNGKARIQRTVAQWQQVKSTVNDFDHTPTRDIIA